MITSIRDELSVPFAVDGGAPADDRDTAMGRLLEIETVWLSKRSEGDQHDAEDARDANTAS
jgi:hypothetical protein